MAVDRTLYERPFRELPRWPCPACGQGRLQILNGWPQGPRPGGEWDEDDYEYTSKPEPFLALMQCPNAECKSLVAVCGETFLQPERFKGDPYEYIEQQVFSPRCVDPAPKMFRVPRRCPPKVRLLLESVFTLFWCDPAAAVGRIRTALERLMDVMGVRAHEKGKRLPLDRRLRIYASADPEGSSLLREVKELGNLLIHDGGATDEDVLRALDIVDHVLETLFVDRDRKRRLAVEAAAEIKKRRQAAAGRRDA